MTERERQRAYYETTAEQYDRMHVTEGDEHYTALGYMAALCRSAGVHTILDVGSGTGRAVEYLTAQGFEARGLEPVEALIDQAVRSRHLDRGLFDLGHGEHLPYPDGSQDATCAFGVMHHVPDPAAVIREMCRVARTAVFISDGNRFGQGRMPLRWVKLALYVLRLWPLANGIKTRGRGYIEDDADGISYSYSVYDSLPMLSAWADRVLVLPTEPRQRPSGNLLTPLLTSDHLLLCALRDRTHVSQG